MSELDNEDPVDRLEDRLGPLADPEVPPDDRALDAEASEADIIEQRLVVESEEDDYGPG
jgi:hypothetical protein